MLKACHSSTARLDAEAEKIQLSFLDASVKSKSYDYMQPSTWRPGPLIEMVGVETRVEWEADNCKNFLLCLSKPIRLWSGPDLHVDACNAATSVPWNRTFTLTLGLQRDRNVVTTLRPINQRKKHRILHTTIGPSQSRKKLEIEIEIGLEFNQSDERKLLCLVNFALIDQIPIQSQSLGWYELKLHYMFINIWRFS